MIAQRVPNYDHIKNFCLNTLLLFICGSVYSLGVFNSAVEKASHIPNALNGIWSSSMPLLSILMVPVMFMAGVILGNARSHTVDKVGSSANWSTSIHGKIRILCSFGCVPYAMMALSPQGIISQNTILLRFIVTIHAIPMGICKCLF